MHHEHRPSTSARAGAGAGQVVAIDAADAVGVQHEAQADEQAGQEEERQQARRNSRRCSRAAAAQVAGFCNCSGLNGLVVVRWKPIAAGSDQQRRQRRQQQRSPWRANASRNSASTTPLSAKPDHDDGDDPVAVFRPLRDGEIAGQRGLVADRGQRDEEQRQQRRAGRAPRSRPDPAADEILPAAR